jgi:methylated-DNA-[protein]-cysteine S-methyltransferase
MSSDATDPATQLGAFDPVVRPPVLPATDVSYVVEDTAVGRMLLASTAAGDLVASAYLLPGATEELWLERLARAVSPRVLPQPAALDEVRRELSAYLAGERRTFDLRVDLSLATPFQRVVLTGLRESVPYGQRTTYGALARRIGRPSASRAVGAALGANPLCVVLPCHRVVASSGALTGYAGGLAAKERLLALESA